MPTCPERIDGARVVCYTTLDSRHVPTEFVRHSVNGSEVESIHGLAVGRYEEDEGLYLLYCDLAVVPEAQPRDGGLATHEASASAREAAVSLGLAAGYPCRKSPVHASGTGVRLEFNFVVQHRRDRRAFAPVF
jgi:hypothetical protein